MECSVETRMQIITKSGQAVELTIEEAKDVYLQLSMLFQEKAIFIPYQPIVPYRVGDSVPSYYPPWCSDGSTVGFIASSSAQ